MVVVFNPLFFAGKHYPHAGISKNNRGQFQPEQ